MSGTNDNTQSGFEATQTSQVINETPTPVPIETEVSGKETNKKPCDKSEEAANKKSKLKAEVWNHFIKLKCENPKDQRATCKYCEKSLACPSVNGTSGLKNHLSRCKKYPANQDMRQKILALQPCPKFSDNPQHSLAAWSFDQGYCRKMLARMIIVDELPFRHVDHEGFRDFCRAMQPKFFIPSRHTIARDCFDLFMEEKLKLKTSLKKLSSRVCLTTDCWTSVQNLGYMCLTAHFIDDDWKLHKRVINFCPIAGHFGDIIGRTIERCLLDWGIDKIFTITVDNASSNDACLQYLKWRVNSWKGSVLQGEYLHMRCATHILSLIVKDGLTEVADSIIRIRYAVKYVRSSPARLQRFKHAIEQEKIECKALVCLDVETRWNSTYLMLDSALKLQRAFEVLERTDSKYVKDLSGKKGLPCEDDWKHATYLLPFLKVFYETTLKLSGSLYVTGNEYAKQIFGLGIMISEWCNSGDLGLQAMAKKMKIKHDKYWENINNVNIMLFIAMVLDPRCKLEYVNLMIERFYDEINAGVLKKRVNVVLTSMFDSYSSTLSQSLPNLTDQVESDVSQAIDSVPMSAATYMDSMFCKKQKVSPNMGSLKNELEKYLDDDRENLVDSSFDLLGWWKLNSSKYKVLAMMARDTLAMPVSTVASESAFSTGGRVLDSFRSSLSSRVVEALICAQDWMRSPHYISIEQNLEQIELLDLETSCLTEDPLLLSIDD